MQVDLAVDHFALFGLEPAQAIDVTALSARYRELQQALHPDRFAAASDAERRWSLQAAGRVNEAYTTLKSPLERAVYLLSLVGVDIDEETDTRMDPGFLMQQMTLREAIDDLAGASDPEAAVADLRDRLGTLDANSSAAFVVAFDAEDLTAARDAARQWQFIDKLGREVGSAEARLGDAS